MGFREGNLVCGSPQPGRHAYCHPDNFKGQANILFHQKADGAFEDVSSKAGVADPTGKGLGVAFADFDNDGWLDIFVANDSVRQSLYRNRGDGTFEDVAVMAAAGYNENGKSFAGMGVDCADYDNDGLPDVVITTLSNETYPLFHNEGDLSFAWATNTSGLAQISLLYSGWGIRFVDVDNDGLRDILVAQNHVLGRSGFDQLLEIQTPLLARNTGKGFGNISAGAGPAFALPVAARGAAFGDLNNDGQVDAVIAVLHATPLVLLNKGTANHWLGISLLGSKSNRQGIGSRVSVIDGNGKRQVYDVTTAGSYLSANDPCIVAGLGPINLVRSVEVRWPSGRVQTITRPAVDRYLTISEADAK